MNGRVRIRSSGKSLELGSDIIGFLSVFTDDAETSDSLTIESHIFSEGLSKNNGYFGFLSEESEGKSINFNISGSKSLIGHIEETNVLFLDH